MGNRIKKSDGRIKYTSSLRGRFTGRKEKISSRKPWKDIYTDQLEGLGSFPERSIEKRLGSRRGKED